MTLFVEIAAGSEPVIYRSKKRLYLVPPKYLLECTAFACKAQALQAIKRRPDRYEFGAFIERRLREMPTIPQLYHVQRKTLRKRTRAWIESREPAQPLPPETREGAYDHDHQQDAV